MIRARAAVLLAALLAAGTARADGPEGLWITEDGGGVIEIAGCPEGLCGRIAGLDEPRRPDGTLPTDVQGRPMCGLSFIEVAQDEPAHWDGYITDPRSGTRWNATLRVDEAGHLLLRGYVLVPLFGETRTWTRYTGHLGADCAMLP